MYVGLAVVLGVSLLTIDRKLASLPDLPCTVEMPE
jgi:hypothetical protein